MGRQGWPDETWAGSNVQVGCPRPFAVALPTIRTRDPTEEVAVILLPGCDYDWAETFLQHLGRDGLKSTAAIGTIGIKGKDFVPDLDSKRLTAGDGVVDARPAAVLVVAVDQ